MGVGIVIALLIYAIRKSDFLESISTIPALTFVAGIGITLVSRVALSEASFTILTALRFEVSHWEVFHLTWIRGYVNMMIPSGGTATLAAYLKKRVQMSFAQFAVFLVPQTLMQVLAVGAVGAVMTTAKTAQLNFSNLFTLWGIFLFMIFAPLCLLYTTLPFSFFNSPSLQQLRLYRDMLIESKRSMLLLFLYNVVAALMRGVRLYVVFLGLGGNVDWELVLLLSLVSDVAFVVNITPAGIGIRESMLVLTATLLGHSTGGVLTAALVDRAIMIVTIIVFAHISMIYTTKKLTRDAS